MINDHSRSREELSLHDVLPKMVPEHLLVLRPPLADVLLVQEVVRSASHPRNDVLVLRLEERRLF